MTRYYEQGRGIEELFNFGRLWGYMPECSGMSFGGSILFLRVGDYGWARILFGCPAALKRSISEW